jgi:TPR repeat protein
MMRSLVRPILLFLFLFCCNDIVAQEPRTYRETVERAEKAFLQQSFKETLRLLKPLKPERDSQVLYLMIRAADGMIARNAYGYVDELVLLKENCRKFLSQFQDVPALADYCKEVSFISKRYSWHTVEPIMVQAIKLDFAEDFEGAMQLYLKAADQGIPAAMFMIAFLHMNGQGVPENKEEAQKWNLKAAELGHAVAMHNASLYLKQKDNLDEADKWMQRSADAGYNQAMYSVGMMYGTGRGKEKNMAEAIKWFELAANNLNVPAMYQLGYIYDKPVSVARNQRLALEWYEKAVEHGHIDATINAGILYYKGDGIDKDYKMALHLFEKAALKGNAKAMKFIGMMYQKGEGVPQDLNTAKLWFQKANEGKAE